MNYLSKFSRAQSDPRIVRSGRSSMSESERLARGLGWFSIGLGAAELLAAGQIARALGMQDKKALLRAYGAREILSGILCLSVDKQLGLWSRVAGDGLDMTTLSRGLVDENPKRDSVAMALATVAGIALLDVVVAQSIRVEHQWDEQKRDYSNRSGFPNGLNAARSSALHPQSS